MGDRYMRGRVLGQGRYGEVYEATRRIDDQKVAIKRIFVMDPHGGIEFTALREIKYLKELRSEYIVNLVDTYVSGGKGILHLVLEFCSYDLKRVIHDKSIMIEAKHVKCYTEMLLKGMHHLHLNYVFHRDLKPENILFNQNGILKLADFGLARSFASPVSMTPYIVSKWYRAPELLMGASYYSSKVDMWAVGCIAAEIILRTPLFPGTTPGKSGTTDIDQLGKIFNLLGTPAEGRWSGAKLLPNYVEFEPREPMNLRRLFRGAVSSEGTVELLQALLELDPNKRISSEEALRHPYFFATPDSCLPHELPVSAGCGLTQHEPPPQPAKTVIKVGAAAAPAAISSVSTITAATTHAAKGDADTSSAAAIAATLEETADEPSHKRPRA